MRHLIPFLIALCLAAPALADPLILAPPAQYIHPYHGQLIEHVTSWQASSAACRKLHPGDIDTPVMLACAYFVGKTCVVYRYDRSDNPGEVISAKEIEHLRIHEIAHCNGWDDIHTGARFFDD